jgi:hypothetical protein
MFHARWVFVFWVLVEDSSVVPVWSVELERICDASKINAAPKAQLASAMIILRPPDRRLFSIKNLPALLRGEKRAIFIPRFRW